MLDWLGDLVTSTGFAVFAGAFLGALFGYGATRVLDWQETQARRHEAFALLMNQFLLVKTELNPFDPSIHRYLDPIGLDAINILLDGKTLTYQRDAYLIKGLDMLRQSVTRYNEYAKVSNGLMTSELPNEQSLDAYKIAQDKHKLVVQGANAVAEIWLRSEHERQNRWWRRTLGKVWPWYRPRVDTKSIPKDLDRKSQPPNATPDRS